MQSDKQIVQIIDQGMKGEGIARLDGKVVFVQSALKGETVRAQIIVQKKDFCKAKLVEVIKNADFRVTPVCADFLSCGGCDLMHMEYSAQLRLKKQIVENCLSKSLGYVLNTAQNNLEASAKSKQSDHNTNKRLGQCLPVGDVIASPDRLFYRNKIRLSISLDQNNNAVVGLFMEGTNNVAKIKRCYLQKEIHGKALDFVHDFADKNKRLIFNQSTGKGSLRQAIIQDYYGTVVLTLDSVCDTESALKPLNEKMKNEYGENYLLYVAKTAENYVQTVKNIQNGVTEFSAKSEKQKTKVSVKFTASGYAALPKTLTLIGGKKEITQGMLDKRTEITQNTPGTKTDFNPLAFRQVNDKVRDLIYAHAVSLITDGYVIDAFSGCGVMSMLFAQKAKKVWAVEIDQNACDSAAYAIAENGIQNIRLICGDCKAEIPKIINNLTSEQKQNLTVVLDPPRKGCDAEVLHAVKAANPDGIIYISCSPATLARDLEILLNAETSQNKHSDYLNSANSKWKIVTIQPYDMFPQTSHVETLVYLKQTEI